MCTAMMTSSVVTAIGALHDTGSVMEVRIVLTELMRTQRNVSILLAVSHFTCAVKLHLMILLYVTRIKIGRQQ
jgi:ABC-type uncharacterized transport system YnjBCD permease subunit